jgi:ribonuclease R
MLGPVEIERDKLLATLKRAQDPRGLRMHEVVQELGADARGRHRVRALLGELLTEGLIEKAKGPRYRLVGWRPAAAPAPAARGNSGKKDAGATPGSGKAKAAAKPGAATGTIRVHPAGYGFVVRDDAEEDVFVAARNRGAALDGDQVELDTWVGYKGTEGRVVEVIRRGRARVTGILRLAGRIPYLEPDDPRVRGHISLAEGTGGAHEGQVVVAEIVNYPTRPDEPLGARVERVLGEPDDPRTEVAKVIACAEIPDEFPEEVLEAAARVPREVEPGDLLDRVDLRDRPFLTIDPEVARDFDDAVCVEDGPGGTDRLWVAVADVSHYVRVGSAIDLEARIRGVSVYLPDRAIPMLPPALSSGICSLNPDVDRLAMVARLDVDEAGVVKGTQFAAAVIRSRARLDYHGVASALGGDLRGPRARYRDHLPQLERLDRVARRMRAVRRERGALDFDLPEAVVVLDEDDPRRVREVKKSRALAEVRDAYRLVEDCMLAANEAVAQQFLARRRDTLWRVHDVPKEERLLEFVELAESFGAALSVDACRTPRQLRDFMESIAGKPMARALSYLLLRTLKQAVYDVVNVGHFGLASPAYLHFTSPIRRYPDLVVHRLLKQLLRREGMPAGGGEAVAGPVPAREELGRWAADSSAYERRAMEAEREVVDMYRAYLMRDRIGEEYDGIVVGVTGFGLFIEIPDPFVEGLVKVDMLGGDAWVYDEQRMRLVGRSSGRSFSLGDAVRVRIENVSVARRKIDFVLLGHEAAVIVPEETRGRRRTQDGAGRKGANGKERKRRSEGEARGGKERRGRRR